MRLCTVCVPRYVVGHTLEKKSHFSSVNTGLLLSVNFDQWQWMEDNGNLAQAS